MEVTSHGEESHQCCSVHLRREYARSFDWMNKVMKQIDRILVQCSKERAIEGTPGRYVEDHPSSRVVNQKSIVER